MWKTIDTAPEDRLIVIANNCFSMTVRFTKAGEFAPVELGDLWVTVDCETWFPVNDNHATHWCECPPFVAPKEVA